MAAITHTGAALTRRPILRTAASSATLSVGGGVVRRVNLCPI